MNRRQRICRDAVREIEQREAKKLADRQAAESRAAACVAAMQGIEDPAAFVADAMLLAEWLAPSNPIRTTNEFKQRKIQDAARRILAAQKSET